MQHLQQLNYTDDYATLAYIVIYALALVGGIWGICLYTINLHAANKKFVDVCDLSPAPPPNRNLSASVRRDMTYWGCETLKEFDELMERMRRER